MYRDCWAAGCGAGLSGAGATVVTFTLNYACYFPLFTAAAFRGVPLRAAGGRRSAGYDKRQIFFKVTLLQMIKRIVPPMSNEVINLVKDTSLARIIAVYELTFRAILS